MKRARQSLYSGLPICVSIIFFLAILAAPLAFAASPTTTQLSISPSTSVPAGSVVTLTATVTSSGTPLTTGLVTFCDMETAAYCEDSAVLGKVWLTRSGTATLKMALSYGGHNIQAMFQATNAFAGSASDVQTVSVLSGPLPTSTSVSNVMYYGYSGLNQAQLTVLGAPIPTLSGSVAFLDATNGNYQLTSLSLASPTVAYTPLASVGGVPVQKPEYTVIGDFNGDGYLDFAVASNYSNTVQIYLGYGDGTFSLTSTFTSATPAGLVVADFNGDGKLDLAVLNTNTISVYLGNGDGTFALASTPAAGNYPSAFTVADVNGDGIPDFAFTNNYTNKIQILLGVGDGTFVAGNTYSTGRYPEAIVAADFNGDGFVDLAAVNQTDATITVLLGDGTGTFKAAPVLSLPATPYTLVAGDFNGDGITDLAVSAIIQGAEIYLGNGDGTFAYKSTLTNGTSGNGYGIAIADFNGDGKTDLVSGKSLFIGDGFGNFNFAAYAGGSGSAISVGDFNNDGSPDLITPVYSTSSPYNGTVSISLEMATLTKLVSPIKVLGPGAHKVFASYSGDTGHAPSQSSQVTMTGAQIVTATALSVSPSSSVSYGTTVQLTATISPSTVGNYIPSGTVTFKEGTTVLGSGAVSSGMAAMTTNTLAVGSHTVTAMYGGDVNFMSSNSTSAVVTVTGGQTTPTITWSTPAPITYGTPLSATQLNATSGGVDGTFVYTPSAGTVLPVGTQTLSTTFTPTDNVTYTTATATVQLTVQKATPTITTWPTASPINYGQTLASSTLTGGLASVAGGFAFTNQTIAPPVGTSAQSVTFTPSDSANYNPVVGSVNVTVNQVSQTITITTPAPASAMYNTQFTVAATATSGLAVSYSSAGGCSNVGPTFTMTSGTTACTVKFDQAGDANYLPASQLVEAVSAAKATPTVTSWPTASSITYGQTLASSLLTGGTASAPGTFGFTNTGLAPPVGTSAQSVTFTPSDTGDYNPVIGSVNVTVNQATQTITVTTPAPGVAVYNTQFTVAATASSGLAVTYSSAGGCTNVGATFTMTSSTSACSVKFDQAGNANFLPATQVVQVVATSKATPNVTAWPTATSISYGQSLNSSVLSGGTASVPGSFAFTNPGVVPPVGTTAQSVTFTPTDTTNYNSVVGAVSVTVTLASQTITVTTPPPASGAYNTQFTVAATASSGLAVTYSSAGGCTNVGATFTMTSGTTACTVMFDQAGNANYTAAPQVVRTVTATKATPTVTTWPTASPITYGQSLAASTLTGGSASVAGTFAFTNAIYVPPAIGTVSASVTFTPTNPANYSTVTGNINITVNPATLTVTANTASRTYGAVNPPFSPSYSGFVNGDTVAVLSGTPNFATTASGISAVGNYPIFVSAGTLSAANYKFVFVNGTLTVTPAALTITATSQSKTYGQALTLGTSAFTAVGLQNGETVGSVALASTGTVATAGAGAYPIVPSNASGGTFTASNYSIAYVSGTLTVNPAALTITASNQSKTYGVALNLGTTLFTVSGLKNGDTVTAVTLSSAGASAIAAAGTYPISPSNPTGTGFTPGNYNITYTNGTLTVNKASTTTTVTDPGTKKAGTPILIPFTVVSQTTGTPTGTVTVSAINSSNQVVATCGPTTLNNGAGSCTLTINSKGLFTLSAAYSGDSNFLTSTGTVRHRAN